MSIFFKIIIYTSVTNNYDKFFCKWLTKISQIILNIHFFAKKILIKF